MLACGTRVCCVSQPAANFVASVNLVGEQSPSDAVNAHDKAPPLAFTMFVAFPFLEKKDKVLEMKKNRCPEIYSTKSKRARKSRAQ